MAVFTQEEKQEFLACAGTFRRLLSKLEKGRKIRVKSHGFTSRERQELSMNIVLVIDQFDNGNNGTTITARRYAEQLRRRGHRVTILAGGEAADGKICAPGA